MALDAGAAVAIGVSGGKDSSAVAFATLDHLNQIGHRGPRVLIHADLGRIEWEQSLPTCQRLAKATGLELIVVRRAKGDIIARWRSRWASNVRRYAALECVKLILPWSTAAMRFCTSEMKTAVICRELVRRFPGRTILSVTGIRRQESDGRALRPISSAQNKLFSRSHQTTGIDWHSIIEWSLDDVLGYLDQRGFALHPAYTVYGSSRVSCAFCILGSIPDLIAAAGFSGNLAAYIELVDLEATCTFAFKESKWLADIAPQLLTPAMRARICEAKRRAALREAAEARIPESLLYVKGWPTFVPDRAEASLLCDVRKVVANAVDIQIDYTTPAAIQSRYRQLLNERTQSK